MLLYMSCIFGLYGMLKLKLPLIKIGLSSVEPDKKYLKRNLYINDDIKNTSIAAFVRGGANFSTGCFCFICWSLRLS